MISDVLKPKYSVQEGEIALVRGSFTCSAVGREERSPTSMPKFGKKKDLKLSESLWDIPVLSNVAKM